MFCVLEVKTFASCMLSVKPIKAEVLRSLDSVPRKPWRKLGLVNPLPNMPYNLVRERDWERNWKATIVSGGTSSRML